MSRFDFFTFGSVFSTAVLAVLLFSCSHQAPKPADPVAPTCWAQTETCRDAWFAYGDTTGDYGVVDATE